MDEVDLDEFLKEASDAMDDPELLSQFVREKATIAIERFLVSIEWKMQFVYVCFSAFLTQVII
jgi:hypothetical protein